MDSQLVFNQIRGEYETRDEVMLKYREKIQEASSKLKSFDVEHIPPWSGGPGSNRTATWTRVAVILIAVLLAVAVISLVLRLIKLLVYTAAIVVVLAVVRRALRGPR